MQPLHEMKQIAVRHTTPTAMIQDTPVPRLSIYRADEPTSRTPNVYDPMLCVVVSGRKRAYIGHETIDYTAGDALLTMVDLPVVGEVIDASPRSPYLAVALELHRPTLASILFECDEEQVGDSERVNGFRVGVATPELLDATLRMFRLLDHPSDIPVLAPLIERELLYRILTGPSGTLLRQIARTESRMSQISRAIAWMRQNYAQDYSANALAKIAGMSVPSLNRHFRAITAMSPLEYQKQIRLQEARRLLLTSDTDVAGAGHTVGYGSVSQFTREYRRLFGEPPGRDAARLRAAIPGNHETH